MNTQYRPLAPGDFHAYQNPVDGQYDLSPPAPYQAYPLADPVPQMSMGPSPSPRPPTPPPPGFWNASSGHYDGGMGDSMTGANQPPVYEAPLPQKNWEPPSWLSKDSPSTAEPVRDPPGRQNNVPAVRKARAGGVFSSGPGRLSLPDDAMNVAVPLQAGGYASAGNGSVLGNALAGPSNGNAPVLCPRPQWAPAVNTAQPVDSGPSRRSEVGGGALVERDANGCGKVSKRGRGRPRGSKPKPKPAVIAAAIPAATAGESDVHGGKTRPTASPPTNGSKTRPDTSPAANGIRSRTAAEPSTEWLSPLEDEPSPEWLRVPATDPWHVERIRGPLARSWIGRRRPEHVFHRDLIRDYIPGLLPRSRNPAWARRARVEMLE